jgi:cellulose synthase operon protein C
MEHESDSTPSLPTQTPPGIPLPRKDTIRPGATRIWLNPDEAARTVQKLKELCRTKGGELEKLESAAKALRDSGYKQELNGVLREAVTWPDCHPRVGALWVRRMISSNNWDRTYPTGMDELCQRGEIGYSAVIEFLETVSQKGRAQLIRQAVRRHARWLSTHPVGWSTAGRALARVRLYRMAADWMSDWRKRENLDLSVLYSVALALRGVGREAEAHEVVQLALAEPSAEQQFPFLKLWLAQEEALTGSAERAAAHLREVRAVGWDDDAVCLFYLTRGVSRIQRAGPAARREAFWAAYDRVRDHFRKRPVFRREVMLRRQYRRCVQKMARDSGTWWIGLLAPWQSADRWSTLLPLLILPGLQLFAPLYLIRLCRYRRGREK